MNVVFLVFTLDFEEKTAETNSNLKDYHGLEPPPALVASSTVRVNQNRNGIDRMVGEDVANEVQNERKPRGRNDTDGWAVQPNVDSRILTAIAVLQNEILDPRPRGGHHRRLCVNATASK